VDEHAEACIPPPGHAFVALRGGLGVLYGSDGVRGRNADVLTLYLTEGGRRDTSEEHGGGDNGRVD
jgi:hypothetical protein